MRLDDVAIRCLVAGKCRFDTEYRLRQIRDVVPTIRSDGDRYRGRVDFGAADGQRLVFVDMEEIHLAVVERGQATATYPHLFCFDIVGKRVQILDCFAVRPVAFGQCGVDVVQSLVGQVERNPVPTFLQVDVGKHQCTAIENDRLHRSTDNLLRRKCDGLRRFGLIDDACRGVVHTEHNRVGRFGGMRIDGEQHIIHVGGGVVRCVRHTDALFAVECGEYVVFVHREYTFETHLSEYGTVVFVGVFIDSPRRFFAGYYHVYRQRLAYILCIYQIDDFVVGAYVQTTVDAKFDSGRFGRVERAGFGGGGEPRRQVLDGVVLHESAFVRNADFECVFVVLLFLDVDFVLLPHQLVAVDIGRPSDRRQDAVAVDVAHIGSRKVDDGVFDAVIIFFECDDQCVVVDHKVVGQTADSTFGLDGCNV